MSMNHYENQDVLIRSNEILLCSLYPLEPSIETGNRTMCIAMFEASLNSNPRLRSSLSLVTLSLKQGTMAVTSIILCTAAGTSLYHNANSLIIKSRRSEIRLYLSRRRTLLRPLPWDARRVELGRDRSVFRTFWFVFPLVFFWGVLRVVQEGNTEREDAGFSPLK